MDDRHEPPDTANGQGAPPGRGDGPESPGHTATPTLVEARLLNVPDTQRVAGLETRIAIEVRDRRGAGEDPAVAEYLRRYPGQSELVARAFGLHTPPPEPAAADAISTEDATLTVGAPGDRVPALEPGTVVGRRYVIRRVLGKGGCAVVYLAHDPMLDRFVALKMPRSDGFRSDDELAAFLREARNAAQLDFPGIVQTYDVQSEPGRVFIVQQFIDGESLSAHMKSGRVPPRRAAELMVGVAGALEYAHRRGFIHRDIKPANILLDAAGRPYLGDFGLAVHESVQGDHVGELAGTGPYMSPEQVRREVHRLDGRSDLWGLGIILYEMLTGCRPFGASRSADLFDEIERLDPRPPREVDASVPAELSRICLKCLAKRAAERYGTAAELVDDLRHWLDLPAPADARPAAPRVVPRGLRSFDAADADFFLELLPGPRDREGLPESLRFWRRQLERTAPDERLAVCLMYGPSGSGKSSLVKAGLVPRLAPHVLPVYVESTPGGTEARLLRALRAHDPGIPAGTALPEAFERLRAGGGIGGKKVLVILDQFEQWLHAGEGRGGGALTRALRQCDGGALQALVLVRDDFWMSVTRFLHGLEIPQIEGLNSAAVDLFDADHARKVLRAFGRAFGALPEGEPTAEQERFLDRSVRGLAPDGKVVTVRLAVFAEMMKGRPWTPGALDAVGGPEGVDRFFLEETFEGPAAPAGHRTHEPAARAVLRALLPEHGSDIRGRMRPAARLLEASGYAEHPDDFRDLLDVLDGELRLITPTEPDASAPGPPAGEEYYQLTHDFLVPALRAWLTARQRETPRGRAEIRLEERSALWTDRHESRQLPSWWEWVSIRSLTDESGWTGTQREMMRTASRRHLTRAGLVLAAVVALVGAGLLARGAVAERARRDLAEDQVRDLWNFAWPSIPGLLDRMGDRPDLWRDEVGRAAPAGAPAARRTRALLALARLGGGGGLDELAGRLVASDDPEEQRTIREELGRRKDRVVPTLWRLALDPATPSKGRLSAAVALADYDPGDGRWAEIAGPVVRTLLAGDPLLVNPAAEALRPVREVLRRSLVEQFADRSLGESPRSLAAGVLAKFAGDDAVYLDAETLKRLILEATPRQSAILAPLLKRRRDDLISRLDEVVGARVPLQPDAENERQIGRQANAAEALRAMGSDERFWLSLRQSEDPRLRTRLIDRIAAGPSGWEALLDRVAAEREGSVRQAILLGLEPMGRSLSESDRLRAADRLVALYEGDPDGGVHSAAEWVLRRWGFNDRIAAAVRRLAGQPRRGRGWYVTPHLHTMMVIPKPGTFLFGSPDYEPGHRREEEQDERTINYTYAISAHEVTREQFEEFKPDHAVMDRAPERDCPATFVKWYDAARYCRWLSEEEGIPEAERNYPPADEIRAPIREALAEGYLFRKGYRLPTVEEWEYAARSGAATARFFGNATADLDKYAWWSNNADERIWPVGRLRPSPFGLFDIYGNAQEWCELVPSSPDDQMAGVRGGYYRSTAGFVRSAMPEWGSLGPFLSYLGFRIVRVSPEP